ncbi:MAG: fatty acid desaturase [Bacteriovorax sp.]|jgi:fatty acid desaturase
MKILSYKEDIYTLGCMTAFTFFILFPFFGNIPLTIIPFWLIFSFHFSFCVNLINHNHAHVPVFKTSLLNDLFDYWLTLLRGGSAVFIKIIHNINHHQFTGAKDDWFSPENQQGKNTITGSLLYLFVTVKRFKTGARPYYSKMGADFLRKQKIERVLLVAFILTLSIISLKKFVLFVLLPLVFGNFFLVYTNLIFHKGGAPEDKYNHSYNFTNALENTLYFNGGYHTVHHINPSLHWSVLPVKHREIVAKEIKPELITNSMFLHAIKLIDHHK